MSNFYPYDPYIFNPYNIVKGYNNEEGNFSTGDPLEDLKRHAILGDHGTYSTKHSSQELVPKSPELVPEQGNILFMFLGGLPNSEHYNKFLATRDDSLHIIVHPMNLDNFEPTGIFKQMQDEGKLFVVDREHHVKTSWATFSLVSATVFMMQYAFVKKNLNIKKCVLLSGADMPLYNYNIIKTELLKDDKSWLCYTNNNEGGYTRNFLFKSYSYEGGIFDINSMNYVSQWMALDIKHIIYFFKVDSGDKIVRTYKKKNVEYCNGKTNIIEALDKDSDYQKYIDSHVGIYDGFVENKEAIESLIEGGFCVTGDESYFGSVVKFNLDRNNEDFLSNIKTNNISTLKNNAKNIHFKIDDEEKNTILKKYVYSGYDTTLSTDTNRCWYGDNLIFNEYGLQYKLKIFQDKKNKQEKDISKHTYYLVKNNVVKTISHNDLLKLKNENVKEAKQFYEALTKSVSGVSGSGLSGNGSGSSSGFIGVNIPGDSKRNIYRDKYSISTTYTDWSVVNANPNNMFRSFNYKKFTNNKIISEFEDNIINVINNTNPSDFLNILTRNKDKVKDLIDGSTFVKGPSYHPAEYEEYSIQSVINSINLIIFFRLNTQIHDFTTDYECAFQIYNRIIFTNNYISRTKNNFYEIKNMDNKKFGYKLNFLNLSNALNYGALFIRKVTPTGGIEKYTDILLALSEYKLNKPGISTIDINKNRIVELRDWEKSKQKVKPEKIRDSKYRPIELHFDDTNIIQTGGDMDPSEKSIENFNLQNITNTVLQKDNVRIEFTEENNKDFKGNKYFAKGYNSAVYKIKLSVNDVTEDCILKIINNYQNSPNINNLIDKYEKDLKINDTTKKYFIDILYYGIINRGGKNLHYYISPYYNPFNIEPYNYNISDKVIIIKNVIKMLKKFSEKKYYISDLRLDNITILQNKEPILIDYDETTITTNYDNFLKYSGVWHSYYNEPSGKNIDKVYQVILSQFIFTYFLNIDKKEWKGLLDQNLDVIFGKEKKKLEYNGRTEDRRIIGIHNTNYFNNLLTWTLYSNMKELLYNDAGKGLLATNYENNLTLDQVLQYIDDIWIKPKLSDNNKYLINFKNKYYKYKKKYILLKKNIN